MGVLTRAASMAIPLDPKQIVSFEELLMSQVVQQKALTRLLVKKGVFVFSEEEFLDKHNRRASLRWKNFSLLHS